MRCKKGVSLFLIVALSVFSLAMHSTSNAAEKKLFRIGSATLGSAGYIHWEAVSYLVNKNSNILNASSLSTGGSTETVYLLADKKIEIGHGTGVEVVAGNEGLAPFDKKYPVWQVFGWSLIATPLIADAKNTDLNTYMDLKGESVSLIKKGSGTETLYKILLSSIGVYKDVNKNYLSFADSFDALADGIIAATPASMPDGIPVPSVQDLASRMEFKMLKISAEEIAKATAVNKAIVSTTVPKGAFPSLKEAQLVPAFATIGISSPDVDDDTIYELTKIVFEKVEELRKLSKVTSAITLENSVKWLVPGYPVHPGAARYFKEKGVWRDDLVVGQR